MSTSVFDPTADAATFLPLSKQTPAPAGGVTSRTLLKTPGGKSMVFSFDAGQELSEHTNPNHAILSGLTGTVVVTAGELTATLGPGDLFYMPPKLPHAVKAEKAASFVLQLLAPDNSN